jgi:hypothetical protein
MSRVYVRCINNYSLVSKRMMQMRAEYVWKKHSELSFVYSYPKNSKLGPKAFIRFDGIFVSMVTSHCSKTKYVHCIKARYYFAENLIYLRTAIIR